MSNLLALSQKRKLINILNIFSSRSIQEVGLFKRSVLSSVYGKFVHLDSSLSGWIVIVALVSTFFCQLLLSFLYNLIKKQIDVLLIFQFAMDSPFDVDTLYQLLCMPSLRSWVSVANTQGWINHWSLAFLKKTVLLCSTVQSIIMDVSQFTAVF